MLDTRRITQATVVLLSLAGTAPAQTNLETNAGIQFNFLTPGAANLALGGAFIALADDATAAYTNPAGLANLLDPELYIEARSWNYTHVYTDRGRPHQFPPTNCGGTDIPFDECIDTIPELVDGEEENRVDGVSYLSYAYPHVFASGKWAFALYRHELVHFEADFTTEGAFLELTRGRSPTGIPGERDGRLASLVNRMDLEIVTFGLAAAWRVREGLSVGMSLAYFDFALDSQADRYVPGLFEREDFRGDPVNSQTQRGDEGDVAVTVGVLWESPKRFWSVGAVYRQGPDFGFRAESTLGTDGMNDPTQTDPPPVFHVPDVYGLGLALRPTPAIRVTLDVDRVEYADLLDDFRDIFNLEMLFPGNPMEGIPPGDAELDRFAVDDATEVHLGFEYFFYRLDFPFSLRLGAWHDPDHSLRFEGENVAFQAVFRPRGDQTHISFGISIARERFQVDAAFDYAERLSTLALSGIYRF